jgi:hypothetical protein
MAKSREAAAPLEQEMADALKTLPRLPRHESAEFEVKRSAIEYAQPSLREDFTEAAAGHDPQPELPAERVKVVEQGLTAMQQVYADRDRLRREVASLRVQLAEANARITGKEREEHVIEERVRQCLTDRDNAVGQASELRGVLSSLAAILVGYWKQDNHQHDNTDESKSNDQPA